MAEHSVTFIGNATAIIRYGSFNRGDRRRVVVAPDGPIMVQGPVEIEMPDGTTVVSDRFLVALCTCRRSHRYPLCDTSHRCKIRGDRDG
ncbi:CDGSH iron-sulfur domain-containing protein [Actinomadura sp. HBU206391]|uniref:CDGSH iron-sulfur domain-containing protein n=1 Tax=Actinomadura sp. HBU206391 TaxID=2731692 RepID=UPI00164F626C|nr:CDGSH iron-sulfur domain-containing protein [Actinomadura sp. HBU206391]